MSKLFELLNSIISKLNLSVKMESQELTDKQKSQVRENIGAASIDDIGKGGGSIEQVQADYIQEDSTQPDYIKNRPFYDNRVKIRYSYADNPNPVSFDCAPIGYSFYKISDMVLTKEEVFGSKFTINGREIDIFAENDVIVETNELLIVQDTSVGNGYGFCFCNTVGTCSFPAMGYTFSVDVPEVGIYRVYNLGAGMSDITSIEIVISGELKTLDLKYLPKNMALGYDTRIRSYYSQAENPNPLQIDNTMMNMSFYKVSDLIPTRGEIFNSIQLTINGREYTLEESGILIETDNFIVITDSSMSFTFVFVNKSGVLSFTYQGYSMSIEFPEGEEGIYYTRDLNAGVPEGRTIEFIIGELKQIDKKFIPEIDALPKVSDSDNGKFLCVENGVWTTKSMEEWSGGSY